MAWARGRGGPLLADFATEQCCPVETRCGWSNAEYDRIFEAYTTTLSEPERVSQAAQLERILIEELPVIPHFFGVETTPHISGLQGPVARHAPNTSGPFLHVQDWEWR
ncbi:MAG: hypothetical protein GEU73_10855 [Chloroflexi bacterium]|nr:hypothetical protein [Chloroflexota bacterium]